MTHLILSVCNQCHSLHHVEAQSDTKMYTSFPKMFNGVMAFVLYISHINNLHMKDLNNG